MRTNILKSTIPILGICFFTLFSCSKDNEIGDYYGEYELSGYVRDKITRKPLPYTLVGVSSRHKEDFSGWGGQGAVTGSTDQNGKYTLKFFVDSKENIYDVMAEARQYFPMNNGGQRIEFTKDGKGNHDILLMPKSYIKYIIKGNKGGGIMRIHMINSVAKYGMNADTFLTTTEIPGNKTDVGYSVYTLRDSLLYKRKDKIVTPPLDTAYYLIEF